MIGAFKTFYWRPQPFSQEGLDQAHGGATDASGTRLPTPRAPIKFVPRHPRPKGCQRTFFFLLEMKKFCKIASLGIADGDFSFSEDCE